MRALRLVAAAALLALPVALALGARELLGLYARAVTPWKRGPEPVFVQVPAGASAGQALRALEREGVLADARLALRLLERSGRGREVKAGEYRFERPLAPLEVLRRLVEGAVFVRRFTVPEGLNRYEIALRFESEGWGRGAEFLAASADPAGVADLDPRARDLEGYLFPDTYHLARGDGAAALVRQMLARFRASVGPEPQARAAATGLDLRQVVTLASLVEKETSRAEERPLVAGVYRERLRRNMLLQADPTVIYGLLLEGRFDGDLRRAHLREPGAYNTYVHPGLPPGPIANPGRAALDAAFAPAPTDYLYFVSRNDGSHAFSRSLAEHNRGVERWQRAYWRDLWRRQRR